MFCTQPSLFKSNVKVTDEPNAQQIIKQALQLNANERFSAVNALLNSLDEPDENLDKISRKTLKGLS